MVSTWLNGLVSGTVLTAAGYFGGGYQGGYVTTVDRFLFSDDSRSTLGTGLSVARQRLAGMASPDAGYFGGGYGSSGTVATVDRFLFSDDSRTTLGTGLSGARYFMAGMANTGA